MRTFDVLFCLLFVSACQSQPVELIPKVKHVVHKIGEDSVLIEIMHYGEKQKPVFVSLHDDEQTAIQAATLFLKQKGGVHIRILNKGERMIRFSLDNQSFRFDPNRMFSTQGIIASLVKNRNFSPDAVKQINDLANRFLTIIPTHEVLLALHNNDEENLSVHSFSTSGSFHIDARHVHVHSGQDQDNFYFVTDSVIHKKLGAKYNSVLQHNQRTKDDGSLSVYYGRRNLKYINIEVQHGNAEDQFEMIEFAVQAISADK